MPAPHDVKQEKTAKIFTLHIFVSHFMMQRLNPDVDIVLDILKAVMEAQPMSSFTQSLYRQYIERGGLSKKQLEGLYNKAMKVKTIPPNKMATLEAIILRKHSKQKSELPPNTPLYEKDEETGKIIKKLLSKYPTHKRLLFLQAKYENSEILLPTELSEISKFLKVLK
jgi:hypothetical protein